MTQENSDEVLQRPENETEKLIEEKELPTFEVWHDRALRSVYGEKFVAINSEMILHTCRNHTELLKYRLRKVFESDSGKFKADSGEFTDVQKLFADLYQQILLLRLFLCSFYSLRIPELGVDVLPNRYDFGVMLSEEDWEKIYEYRMERTKNTDEI